jgi:restriction endonuclease Mrr
VVIDQAHRSAGAWRVGVARRSSEIFGTEEAARLIDGTELTRLMVRYDVGVTAKETYQLKSVDDDFFEDSV